jgi:hypothetical protein
MERNNSVIRCKCDQSQDDSLAILNILKNYLNARLTYGGPHASGIPQLYYQVDMDKFLETAPVEQQ